MIEGRPWVSGDWSADFFPSASNQSGIQVYELMFCDGEVDSTGVSRWSQTARPS